MQVKNKSDFGGAMSRKKVLFVCVHNSARSQMAEALLNNIAPDRFIAESAGLTPGTLNPLAVEAMKEIGIDISGNSVDSVFDFFKAGKIFSHINNLSSWDISPGCLLNKLNYPFNSPIFMVIIMNSEFQ
jgi:arsenate reductase